MPGTTFKSLTIILLLLASAFSVAQPLGIALGDEAKKPSRFLEVIDSYAEVHSGPGRGYPVFYVIEQGEQIEVLARRPGWYEIRSQNGKVGWTTAAQIARTIQATGEPADLPTVGYGDYVKNSWVTGFSAGEFASGELSGFETFSINVGYRFYSWLGVDGEFGRLFGADRSGDYLAANIYLEPAAHWKLSPFLSVGGGELTVKSQPKLAIFERERENFESYGLGASFYLGRNFVIKAEYRWYSVSIDLSDADQIDATKNTEELESWRIGFNTFF